MKRILLLAMTAAAMAAPAGAHAAAPCRDKIYNEWYATGKISTTYPVSCYQDALRHVPTDARIYSNLSGDIKAALQAAIGRRDHPGGGSGGPTAVGSGPAPTTGPHQVKGQSTTAIKAVTPPNSDRPQSRPSHLAVAPLASSASGGGVPTPILVLGAIAILLALAGLVGAGFQARKRQRPTG